MVKGSGNRSKDWRTIVSRMVWCQMISCFVLRFLVSAQVGLLAAQNKCDYMYFERGIQPEATAKEGRFAKFQARYLGITTSRVTFPSGMMSYSRRVAGDSRDGLGVLGPRQTCLN